jgi:hypothetical protein
MTDRNKQHYNILMLQMKITKVRVEATEKHEMIKSIVILVSNTAGKTAKEGL